MKIIKKSELKECECACCHSVMKPKHKDLVLRGYIIDETYWRCPLCKTYNKYKF